VSPSRAAIDEQAASPNEPFSCCVFRSVNGYTWRVLFDQDLMGRDGVDAQRRMIGNVVVHSLTGSAA